MRYGVQSRPNVAGGAWTRLMFSTGADTIVATNEIVEATVNIPSIDQQRFFRVVEAD